MRKKPMKRSNCANDKACAAKINQMHSELTLSLRMNLDRAAEIGGLLADQKTKHKHGEWMNWCAEHLAFSYRSAMVYIEVHANRNTVRSATTIEEFSRQVRSAKKAIRRMERELIRSEMSAKATQCPDANISLNHADCRTFAWPQQVDFVATDPPWASMDCYEWLGEFCGSHLRQGGLAMVQLGTLFAQCIECLE